MKQHPLATPPKWTEAQLKKDRELSIELFRDERVKEPLEKYLEFFQQYELTFAKLLETTADLTQLFDKALEVLTDKKLTSALRYLSGPPISLDDLLIVAEAPSIAPKALKAEPALVKRLMDSVMLGLDRRRFPWMSENRKATQQERASAILASAAMMASSRVAMTRRMEGKDAQEGGVKQALKIDGFKEVPTREARTLADAPRPGEFCGESVFGTRKADVLIGMWDNRILPLECKVSNSATNSIKRLNNDAAVKAELWNTDFGERNIVPSAMLSGVYNMRSLKEAQDRGLTLFWAHDLAQLTSFIASTRG